jgi:hypothetical protein
MSEPLSDIELLSTSPPHEQSDVDMVANIRGSTPAQTELSRLTSLSLAETQQQVYVEVKALSSEQKAKYATDLAERLFMSDEEFPEEQMERVIGEYRNSSGLYYFVRMSSGIAFKVGAIHYCHL